MKAFLYKAKGAVALTLAMSMFCPQVFAAEALSAEAQGVQAPPKVELSVEEVEAMKTPTITVEEALKKAIKHSPGLRDLDDSLELLLEQDEKLYDRVNTILVPASYEHRKWVSSGLHQLVSSAFALEQGITQMKMGREQQEMVLEMTVKTYFQTIISLEDTVELLKESAAMQQKTYEQGYTRYRLGMLSKYNLDQLQGNAQKAKDTLAMTESSLEQLYITFNSLIGVNPDERFEFLYDVTFEAYELPLPIDLYIHNKMNEDINIKMQELSMEAAKFAANYRNADAIVSTDDNDKLTYDQKKRALKTAKDKKETLMRNTYLKIQSLETEYSSAQADLNKAQADYRAAQVSYQAGMATKMAVDGAAMGVTQAENALKSIVYEHNMLVFQFENPSVLFDQAAGATAQ